MKSATKGIALGVALMLAAAGAALAGDAKVGNLQIVGAWARASAGPAQNGAAFMTITNAGGEPDKLLAAAAAIAATTELHTHLQDGGVMRMRQVPAIELPAGQTVAMQPGGYHVMFMGLNSPLKQGTSFPLTLTFEKAGEVAVEVAVGEVGAMGPMDMGAGGMPHGHMSGHR